MLPSHSGIVAGAIHTGENIYLHRGIELGLPWRELVATATRHFFLCPIPPRDLAESIYMIPTTRSSSSFFLRSLDV